jgi:plasmid replication initiation protein
MGRKKKTIDINQKNLFAPNLPLDPLEALRNAQNADNGKKKRRPEKAVRLITKSNRLIEARHNLDIWELRVFTKMLLMINQDSENLDFIIPIREIIKDFELPDSQQSYQYLRLAADSLLGRKVYIYKQIEGNKWERQATTLIKKYAVPVVQLQDGTFVEAEHRDRYIRIGFDEDMRNHILNYRDSFTKLNLAVLAKLPQKSFRIYELMKQYEDTMFRTMTVEELRDVFDLSGQYNLYGSIKQRIIDKAQKDLDKHADITFTYEEVKKGRAVHRINFYIKPNPKNSFIYEDDDDETTPQTPKQRIPPSIAASFSPLAHMELSEEKRTFLQQNIETVIKNWEVTPLIFAQLVEQYDIIRLQTAIDVTRKTLIAGKIKGSVAGFFVEAVRGNYLDAQPRKAKTTEKNTQKETQDRQKTISEAFKQSLEAQRKANFEREKAEVLDALAHNEQLREDVETRMRQSMFYSLFEEGKTFDELLEKPAFYGAVHNIVREIMLKI